MTNREDAERILAVGRVLGDRYRVERLLGGGGVRETWLAVDLESDRLVVVKLLGFGAAVGWENVKLFEREALVLKQLNHPQIPRYRDYFCFSDRVLWFVLVEDYVPGCSFAQLLAQGRKFSEPDVENVAISVLQILIYLHELSPPVLHRDLKPSNLILGDDDSVYLVDFGAVQDRVAVSGGTFTVVGTYGYAPMEQFSGRAVFASDLYALGTTLIHLVTGISPADLPQKDLRLQFRDLVSVSPFLVQWLEYLTEPAPERRPQTARQALDLLQAKQPIERGLAKTFKPSDTRIRLKKSIDELNIFIPAIGINISNIPFLLISTVFITPFLAVGAIFGIGFLLRPGLLSIIPAVLIGAVLAPFVVLWFRHLESSFSSTQICLDKDEFIILSKLFGFIYRQQQGCSQEIQDVFLEAMNETIEQPNKALAIETGGKKYFVSPPLTDVERRWLIQEIKSWLNVE
ncbi:serine/threonine protein kinase [Aliterella atlantica]|uniref:serine/threonine protein kinase n=1 Tax=Aliterella atlantica TaxID=1827278 RepID=UPI000B17BE4E|nr:serine/threonine-protein kinase [Aliterella atlantica]